MRHDRLIVLLLAASFVAGCKSVDDWSGLKRGTGHDAGFADGRRRDRRRLPDDARSARPRRRRETGGNPGSDAQRLPRRSVDPQAPPLCLRAGRPWPCRQRPRWRKGVDWRIACDAGDNAALRACARGPYGPRPRRKACARARERSASQRQQFAAGRQSHCRPQPPTSGRDRREGSTAPRARTGRGEARGDRDARRQYGSRGPEDSARSPPAHCPG